MKNENKKSTQPPENQKNLEKSIPDRIKPPPEKNVDKDADNDNMGRPNNPFV